MKETPFELYVGFPLAVNSVELPCVKSTVVDFPRAGSAGQEPVSYQHSSQEIHWI